MLHRRRQGVSTRFLLLITLGAAALALLLWVMYNYSTDNLPTIIQSIADVGSNILP